MLPPPDLGNLPEIENMMRAATSTPGGREALGKFVITANYIPKLIPLVEMAEDLESVTDLHRLCSIMKMLILLNDTTIIEFCVTDDVFLGVVGALECRRTWPHQKPTELILIQTTPTSPSTRPTIASSCLTSPDSKKS